MFFLWRPLSIIRGALAAAYASFSLPHQNNDLTTKWEQSQMRDMLISESGQAQTSERGEIYPMLIPWPCLCLVPEATNLYTLFLPNALAHKLGWPFHQYQSE